MAVGIWVDSQDVQRSTNAPGEDAKPSTIRAADLNDIDDLLVAELVD